MSMQLTKQTFVSCNANLPAVFFWRVGETIYPAHSVADSIQLDDLREKDTPRKSWLH